MNLQWQFAQRNSLKSKKMRLETAPSAQSKRIFCALFFGQAILQQPLSAGLRFRVAPRGGELTLRD
jgi:hypothetical protein